MSHRKTPLSRRGFLKGGTAAALGGVVAAALPAVADAAPACASALPKRWDATADVVVIGSGFAGLTAAVEARGAGASVLILEKMPVHGGNSIINGGDFAAAGNTFQKEAGVEDSPEQMLKDMLKAGANLNNPELARIVAERSNEALEWTKSHVGAAKRPAPAASDRCLACHGPYQGIVEKTSKLKPLNPHDSPHWGADIECAVCHRQHEKPVNWCAYCHTVSNAVP